MSDNSVKPILIAGAVGTVALLGVAWNFTANVSEQSVIDAQQFAAENSSPMVAEVATMPEDPALPEPEAETAETAAPEETEVAEVEEPAEEVEVAAAEEAPAEETELTDIEVVPADDEEEVAEEAEVASADEAPAEEAPAEEAQAEEAAPEETEVAAAEEAPAEETPAEEVQAEEAAPEETEVAAAEEAEAPAAEEAAPAAATAMASIEGDAKAGKRVWRKCQACHKMGDGAKNAVGPQLNNIIGRTIGGVDGFKYSDGFIALRDEGKVWTVEALDEWLLKPRDYIAGTKMAFGGLRKEADRQNVIAYMNEEGQ